MACRRFFCVASVQTSVGGNLTVTLLESGGLTSLDGSSAPANDTAALSAGSWGDIVCDLSIDVFSASALQVSVDEWYPVTWPLTPCVVVLSVLGARCAGVLSHRPVHPAHDERRGVHRAARHHTDVCVPADVVHTQHDASAAIVGDRRRLLRAYCVAVVAADIVWHRCLPRACAAVRRRARMLVCRRRRVAAVRARTAARSGAIRACRRYVDCADLLAVCVCELSACVCPRLCACM